MTEPTQLPFVLNQAQIDAAVANELLKPSKDGLNIDYTSGRPPRGLTGAITISEDMIRRAVIAHARKLVNPMFTHFSVEFVATRGDDGLTANIIASNMELAPEEPVPAAVTARPSRAAIATAPAETMEEDNGTEEVNEDASSGEGANPPWEDDGTGESQDAVVEQVVQDEPADEAEAPKPAPAARARLFADLKRPSNETAE